MGSYRHNVETKFPEPLPPPLPEKSIPIGITKPEISHPIVKSLTTLQDRTPPTPSPPPPPPPSCPTPDYYSDNNSSLPDNQSIDASQTVKTSILKFEEKNKRSPKLLLSSSTNGGTTNVPVHKTVTFGVNSTKEITPLKKSNCKFLNAAAIKNHFINMSDKKQQQQQQQQQQQDKVEMQSIESLDLTEPKKISPKPPQVYFQKNDCRSRAPPLPPVKKTTVIKITEYPTDKPRREPSKFDFINRNSKENGFDSELASTLLRSNLKNKVDAFSKYSNGNTVIKTGNDKSSTVNNVNCISGRLNSHHPICSPTVIPTGVITENQISTAKKSLKTFEKNSPSNTVVFKIPKIN
ncbi:hypothetical protein Phum_PHUM503250 [Pediculus humanus corporis]|uniref:Uncharacterized protein n=1 Tax=Pediculus humanus subsp. corporis TaxID=121224 RepID=E0VXP3_PEDHC|nr:uncharacterized protein Phum_PHUM503250 [Pediculus humanus corporis]EEB18149.1 hypothetical protein Phum_PHUM503250 [Pediculus humanus corporis]